MHFKRTIAVILTGLWAQTPLTAGASSAACDVADALERMQFAQMRLATSGNITTREPDSRLLASHLLRLDRDSIVFALRDDISPEQASLLQAYFDQTLLLSNLIARDDQTGIQVLVASDRFRQSQLRVSRILPLVHCNTSPVNGVSARSTSGEARDQTSSSSSRNGFTLPASGFWIIAAIISAGIIFKLVGIVNKWQNGRQTRAKRYPVYYETDLRSGDNDWPTTIFDISCNGAKVQTSNQHNLLAKGQIRLLDTWHPVTKMWANPHYCGLQFTTPISSSDVRDMRQFKPKTRT